MSLFKKKVKIEDFAAGLIASDLPDAIDFFHKENQRAHFHLNLDDTKLLHIGGGLCLNFLADKLGQHAKTGDTQIRRATKAVRRAVSRLGGSPDRAQEWWQAMVDDARIIHDRLDILDASCHSIWHRTYRDRPFKDHGPIRSFAYMLQVDVNAMDNLKII
jgi:hypothetical protein